MVHSYMLTIMCNNISRTNADRERDRKTNSIAKLMSKDGNGGAVTLIAPPGYEMMAGKHSCIKPADSMPMI